MKFIETPLGEIFKYFDCKIFDEIIDESETLSIDEDQKELSKELFENTGILTGNMKGGDNTE